MLQTEGLALGQIRFKSDEDRMPGVVLQQRPTAGTKVGAKAKIDLVVNSSD
jgi:beta-lactam-binding protein with PASTA domain